MTNSLEHPALAETPRCAFYGRCATLMQGAALKKDQLRSCEVFAAEHDWRVQPEHVYFDVATFGTTRVGRVGLNQLEAAAASGLFDRILVDSTSRIARNGRKVQKFVEYTNYHNVHLTFVSQQLDCIVRTSEFSLLLVPCLRDKQVHQ